MASPEQRSTRTRRAAFIYSPELERYPYPPDCPFRTERAAQTRHVLASMGLLSGDDRWTASMDPADRPALEEFHSPGYLDVLQRAGRGDMDAEGLHMGLGTPETPVFRGLYEYAALACGASLTAAKLILTGQAEATFNPSGGYHHAHPAMASGFCYLNDVVLACLHLAEAGRRVVFLDVDVHHCDGVQEAFYSRSDVMTISLHQTGRTLFPGTGFEDEIGTGEGRGYSANVPLPPGTYDEAYLRAFRAVALPLIAAHDPDVIVLEVGMDGLAGDPLAQLNLTNNAYAEAVQELLRFEKPILATGGGGYHVDNTVRGWTLLWTILCGQEEISRDLSLGLGGVMLETTDWAGGLRDRARVPDARQRRDVDAAVAATIEKVRANVFRYHGL